jgi:hypothetical protein
MNTRRNEQAADHGQHGAHVADYISAGGKEDGAGGRPEERLDHVVPRIRGMTAGMT